MTFNTTNTIVYMDTGERIPVESVTVTQEPPGMYNPATVRVEVTGVEPPMKGRVLDLQTRLHLVQEEATELRQKLNAAVDVIAELQQSDHKAIQGVLKAVAEKKVQPQHRLEWDKIYLDKIYSSENTRLTREELYRMYERYDRDLFERGYFKGVTGIDGI